MGLHTNQTDIYIDCDASAPSSDHGNISNPYESWRAMIDGQGRDITSAGVITIYMKGVNGATSNKGNRGGGDGSGCDYTTVADTYAFSGTFNASNHIDLKAWPGSEGDGSFDSAPSFTGDPGSSYLFNLEEYCEWDGIDIKYSGGLSNRYGLFISENAKVRNFIIQNNGSRSIHFQQAVEISNGIVYGTSGVEAETNYQSDTYLSYLTVINDGSGGSAFNSGTTSNNLVLKNCVAYGGWTDEFGGTSSNYDSASTNNAGETASASVPTNIQTNYVEISSDPFADSASDDYSVGAGSALIDGTPVSGITTDIIGTTRDGTTPTIGAFEVAAASSSSGALPLISGGLIG